MTLLNWPLVGPLWDEMSAAVKLMSRVALAGVQLAVGQIPHLQLYNRGFLSNV